MFPVDTFPGAITTDRMHNAIAAAAAAGGGVVLLGPGTYPWTGTPPKIPPNLDGHIVIRGSGRGVTTVALTQTCNRLVDFAKVADNDVFRNVTIEDLTIDAAGIPKDTATGHAIIGTSPGGQQMWEGSDVSISDITVRRVSGINAPSNSGPGDSGTKQFYWINLAPWSFTDGPPQTVERILIEDLDMHGGETGIAIGGWRKTGGTTTDYANVYCNDITIRRWSHVFDDVPTEQLYGNHIILGARGWGGRAYIADGFATRCWDVGVEIDSMRDVTVERVHVRDSWHGEFYHTQYNPLAAAQGPQRIIYRDCTAERRDYTPATIQQGTTQGYGWYFSHNAAIGPCADITIENSQFLRRGPAATEHAVLGSAIWAVNVRHLDIDGFLCDEEVSFVGGTGAAPAAIAIQPEPGNTTYLRMRRVRWKIAGSKISGGDTVWAALRLRFGTVDFDIDDCAVDYNIAGVGSTSCRALYLGDDVQATTVKGTVRKTRLERSTDPNGVLVCVPPSSTTTVLGKILIDDCDIRPTTLADGTSTGNSLIRFNGSSLQNYGGVQIRNSPVTGKAEPAPPAAITATASPMVYRNIEGYAQRIVITGGTVSNVEWSQDGSTYLTLGSVSGAFAVAGGEYLRITYTVAPTITKVIPR